jgi:outer membrane protein OmpA-like peptidoglycan-associated protein/opacity protein-like surface antigen
MAQTFRRGSRVGLALAVGACLSFAAARAVAQDSGDTSEGVKVQLGVLGGYHWFAHDLELGVPDDSSAASPKSSATFGIRIGLQLNPMFVIEGQAQLMPTHDNKANASVYISAERLQLRFNIAPGAIAHGAVTPFIFAGVGGSTVLSSKGGSSQLAIQSGDTDANFFGGAGVMFALSKLVHLRLDGAVLAAPNTTKDGFSPDYELTLGIGVTLGGHAPPPPPPVVPLVKDTDGDGIPDAEDNCPNEAGPRENKGCPDKDTDGDGVIDRKDKCPDKAGPPERDGCPEEDKDGDGIVDSKDKCPDDAEDKDGFEDADGCPDPDNDKDGILDKDDKCPNEPETKNGYQDEDGCPDEVPAQVKQFSGVVKGINFRRNSADIKATSFPFLKQAVTVFKEYPALRVEISGHTSNEGKREFNMKLSRKRAEAVKDYLVSAGIDEKRVGTIGYGPDKPIADNDTKDGQEKNRRIEFRLLSAKEEVKTQPEPEDINPAPERKHPKGAKAKGGKPAKADKPADRADKAADKANKAADKADKAADKADKAADDASTKKPKAKKKKASAPDDEPMPK